MRSITLFLSLVGLVFLPFRAMTITSTPVPSFDLPAKNTSNAGHIQLAWHFEGALLQAKDLQYELQRARTIQFTNPEQLYHGPDLASFVSGMSNGDYYFRVRSIAGSEHSKWSKVIVVKVAHHSLTMAYTLFGIGGLVFIMTVALVVTGARKNSIA